MNGQKIKNCLALIGQTDNDVATRIDISIEQLQQYYSLIDVPSSFIEKVASELNVPISLFYEGQVPEQQNKTLEEMLVGNKSKIRRTSNLGKKVQRLLKEQKKTQATLAHYAGVTPTGLNTIFRRESCKLSTLTKIANFLGVPVYYFLADTSNIALNAIKDSQIAYLQGEIKVYKDIINVLRGEGQTF